VDILDGLQNFSKRPSALAMKFRGPAHQDR
jgi:hypothetical protein